MEYPPHIDIQTIDQKLWQWAKDHEEQSNGEVIAIGDKPEDSKFHELEVYTEGQPVDLEGIKFIANQAVDNFDSILDGVEADKSAIDAINLAREALVSGNNVAIITNHGDLKDIAVAQAAIYCKLSEQQTDFESSIIINRMVKYLAFNVGGNHVPAIDVLKLLENHIYLSVPDTSSAAERGVRKLIHRIWSSYTGNESVSEMVKEKLSEGRQLLAVAPSGTTDKSDSNGLVHLHKVKDKTIELLGRSDTYIMPIAIRLDGEEPLFKIASEPFRCRTRSEFHESMQQISATLNTHDDQNQYTYDY